MKRLIIIVGLLALVGCTGIVGPLAFTVELHGDRPPCDITLTCEPQEGGVYSWIGPWGVEQTLVPTAELHLGPDVGNPVVVRCEWTDGVRSTEDQTEIIFENSAPIVLRRFVVGPNVDWYVYPWGHHTLDFRNCAEDPDGDEVKLVAVRIVRFFAPAVLDPFGDPLAEIMKWYPDGVTYQTPDETIYTPPLVPGKIWTDRVEGIITWFPCYEPATVGNMIDAPVPIGSGYVGTCLDMNSCPSFPIHAAEVHATFRDSMGAETTHMWIILIGANGRHNII